MPEPPTAEPPLSELPEDGRTDAHIPWQVWHAGQKDPRYHELLVTLLLDHLAGECDACLTEGVLYAGRGEPGKLVAFRAGDDGHGERARRAARDLAALKALAPGERAGRIRRARPRLRSPELAELLLLEARGALPARPAESDHWALLALAVLEGEASPLAAEPTRNGLAALAHAFRANAYRLQERYDEARALFLEAHRTLIRGRVTDHRVQAQILTFEAALAKVERNLPEAAHLLQTAFTLWQSAGYFHEAAETCLGHSTIAYAQGDTPKALRLVRSGRVILTWDDRRIGPRRARPEPPADGSPSATERLELMLRHTEALYLTRLVRLDEAQEVVDSIQDLYDRFPAPWYALRRRWLEGLMAAGRGDQGQAERAERLLLEVRHGFEDQGSGYDAALVSLDLALLYLETDQLGRVRHLGAELVPAFQGLGVPREALMAAELLREADRRQALQLIATLRTASRSLETAPRR